MMNDFNTNIFFILFYFSFIKPFSVILLAAPSGDCSVYPYFRLFPLPAALHFLCGNFSECASWWIELAELCAQILLSSVAIQREIFPRKRIVEKFSHLPRCGGMTCSGSQVMRQQATCACTCSVRNHKSTHIQRENTPMQC